MRTFIVMTLCCLAAIQSICVADDKIEWIDYCAKINEACKPPGVPDSENAYPLLQQAAALYVEPNGIVREIEHEHYATGKVIPYSDLTEQQHKGLSIWHKANQPAWNTFVEASTKEYYWQQYDYVGKDHDEFELEGNIEIPLMDWVFYVSISHLGASMARANIAEGNLKAAVEKCAVIIKVGCLVQYSRGPLIKQLIGAARCRLGYEYLLYILDDANLTKDDVLFIEKKLAQLREAIRSVKSSDVENMYSRSLIQNMFSIDRTVQKTIPYANLKKYDDMYGTGSIFSKNKKAVDLKKIARGHADFYEVMHVQGKLEERYSKLAAMRPYERSKLNLQDIIPKNEEAKYYLLTASSLEGFPERIYDLLKQAQLKHEAVTVVASLKRWQADKGSLPETLGELSAAMYLQQVPEDPFSDGKIKYKKNGKMFLLYSNGTNMKDDGGSREIDEEYRWKDLVFWPIEN